MNVRVHISSVVLGTLVAAVIPVSASDWPHWRGPSRDGISSETGWFSRWPSNGPAKLWESKVGIGFSSVAVSKGALFTMGNEQDKDIVHCLDALSGAKRWTHSYPCKLEPNNFEGGPLSTPSVDGDRLYTLSKEGHLFCLDAAKGQVVWSKHLVADFQAQPPHWGFSASPLVLGDAVIVTAGGKGAACIALRKSNGELLWQAGDDKGGYATSKPFVWNDKKLLAEFNAFGLVIRDQATGAESARWKWKTSYDINAITPIVEGSRVFIASGYSRGGILVDIGGEAPVQVWQQKRIRSDFATPVLWRDHLYGVDDKALVCIEFATGAIRWAQDGFGKGCLIVAGGKLIVQTETSGELVVVEANPMAYNELARTKLWDGQSSIMPVLANGLLYAKNNAGTLVCLDVRRK
jgi:outer membrane protein assembly factor BamB